MKPTTFFSPPGLTWRAALLVVAALFMAACGGGSNTPGETPATAAITAQPTEQSVVAGTAATFNVVAADATGYQWQSSSDGGTTFANVNAATSASHTTAATTLADSGTQYRVVVSGASNSVTSSAVTLTVTATVVAPSISVQPAGLTITAGQNASFSITASGTSISYQWQRSTDGGASFTNVAGETNATLNLTVVPLGDNGHQFRVVVSNGAGSVTSNAALLTVNAAQVIPAFSTQPISVTVVAPNTATFSVAVTGMPSPTLQWQLSTDAGGSFADIAGATASSYTTAATVTGDSGNRYRVIATNTAGATTSNAATLTVNPAPVAPAFTIQPLNVTITEGQNAQFTVAVSGTPTPTLQWQLSTDSGGNWSNITGATGTVFNVLNAALANNGRQFRVVASNSAGTAISSAVTLTVIAASVNKAWQTAVLIETGDAGEAQLPQVAVNSQGDAIAVWQQSDGVSIDIYANRYTAAAGWGAAQRIETDNTGVAQSAQVAIDSSGNAIAVWMQSDTLRNNIWANRYTAGAGWGSASLIESGLGDAGNPQIAIDGSGNAIVVWWQHEGGRINTVSNRYVLGTGWSTAAVIESDGTGDTSAPQIGIDANGNAIAVWAWSSAVPNGATFDYNVWANRYTAGTGWGTAGPIDNINTTTANLAPHVALDGGGNAIAVWHRPDGTWDSIWANRYASGTGWGTPALIETDNTNSARDARVAFGNSGNAIAVWTQSFGGVTNVMANRYTAGSGWGTAVLIETDDAGSAFNPRLVIDSNGNATAVWSQRNVAGFTFNIWANRFTAGTGWGAALMIDNDANPAGGPQIGVDANGNMVSVWQQDSGGIRPSIWANTFR